MDKSPDAWGRRRMTGGEGKTNLASCVVATVFLILVAAALVTVFLVFFRPKDPKIQVDAVQLPGFSAANGIVSFTFTQHAAVRNPNCAVFSHYDNTLQLVYADNQVGFMFIPAASFLVLLLVSPCDVTECTYRGSNRRLFLGTKKP